VPIDLEAGLDRLYEAEPEDFVAERKSLAKALKQDGRKDEAAQVEQLRKPTLPAWTVNQLARRKRKDFDALLTAGERLSETQQALLAGDGRAAFAEARRREQAALKRLRDDAAWILGKRASDATLDRVVSTLGSAAVTPDGRAQLAQGRLTADIEPQGFEAFAGAAPATPAKPRRAAAAKPAPRVSPQKLRQEAIAAAREKLAAAREREAEATEELRAADRVAHDARRALDAAERKANRLRGDREAAADAVSAARKELEAAKEA
jgi:hypothetical protein